MKTHVPRSNPFYETWRSMIRRCEEPSYCDYPRYGARGISVCHEWHDPLVFFDWLDVNKYRKGLQVDRIDNDGPYSPDNCHVVTAKENARNRSNNIRYLVHGELLISAEVEEKYGIKSSAFRNRVDRQGMTPEDALLNRRKPMTFTHVINGEVMTTREICTKFGISRGAFSNRLYRNWPAQRAATTPVRGCNH